MQAAGGDVGDRRPRQRRPALGGALGHVQVAADGEVVDVVAGPLGVGAGLAVAAGRAVDDAGVHRPDGLVADAEAVDDAGAEALEHDVGGRRQSQEGGPAALGPQVDLHPLLAPLAAVGVERRHERRRPRPGWRADLDDPGAVVGEQASTGWRPTVDRSSTVVPARGLGHGGLRSSGQAQLAGGDDVLLHLGGAAADRVDDRVPVGRLGPPGHRRLLGPHRSCEPGPAMSIEASATRLTARWRRAVLGGLRPERVDAPHGLVTKRRPSTAATSPSVTSRAMRWRTTGSSFSGLPSRVV